VSPPPLRIVFRLPVAELNSWTFLVRLTNASPEPSFCL